MPSFFANLKQSFYFQVVFGVALPVLIALIFLSMVHYTRERNLVMEQIDDMATLSGEQLVRGLKYAMLHNNRELISKIINDVSANGFAERIQILEIKGVVKYDTKQTSVNQQYLETEPGCIECHQYAPEKRPRTTLINPDNGSLRIAIPVVNRPECHQCHDAQAKYLGLVVMDSSLTGLRSHLLDHLWNDASTSVIVTILVTLIVYWLLRVLVVRRVEVWKQGLLRFAEGDFSARIPVTEDEVGTLSASINYMAEKLESHENERMERQLVREQAIIQERERIARELHDGMAQLLGYVNTKAMAVRLNLQKQRTAEAEKNLLQLEEAAQSLSADVREAILGLRATSQVGDGFKILITDYANQFTRLSGLSIQVEIPDNLAALPLAAEAELQLLRISQEALSNVRKHAKARQVLIQMDQPDEHRLRLLIKDDGEGFDRRHPKTDKHLHFGLHTMAERAESVEGTFELVSAPGQGTSIIVTLPLKKEKHAHPGGR
jgi:signal transduction histidine kinase